MAEIKIIPEAHLTESARQGRMETLKIPGWPDALAYLPYGYDESDARYPVFYLMHGGGGEPCSFFPEDRKLLNTLDHMTENGEIPPMIVVAPTYYTAESRDKGIAASGEAVAAFPPILREKIIPAVDAAYRTIADRAHRAIGGFSMGGVTTWLAFTELMDCFRWYMPLSGDSWVYGEVGGGKHPQETAALLAEHGRGQDFYIHALTGAKDIAYPNLTAQIDAMRAFPDVFAFDRNIRYSVQEDGWHDYKYMTRYIYTALAEFFR